MTAPQILALSRREQLVGGVAAGVPRAEAGVGVASRPAVAGGGGELVLAAPHRGA